MQKFNRWANGASNCVIRLLNQACGVRTTDFRRPFSTNSSNNINRREPNRTNTNMASGNSTGRCAARGSKVTNDKIDFLRLDIGDLKDLSDINELSTKQLRYLLTKNCIDYKGIFEKEVLREKATQLWIEYTSRKLQRNQKINQAETKAKIVTPENNTTSYQPSKSDHEGDDDFNQLCKICMEKEVECVLLDCGHQLCCVTCGRKLNECPICRQNVVRVVRTFRA